MKGTGKMHTRLHEMFRIIGNGNRIMGAWIFQPSSGHIFLQIRQTSLSVPRSSCDILPIFSCSFLPSMPTPHTPEPEGLYIYR